MFCAATHFFARLAHAVVHISGFAYFMTRTVIFTIGWLAFVGFAGELLRHA